MTVELKRRQTSIAEFFGPKSKKSKKLENEESANTSTTDASDEVSTVKSIEQIQTTQKKESESETLEGCEDYMTVRELFQKSLSSMLAQLLALEIETIEPGWFSHMKEEF